jgi:hypothetical protein
LNQISISARRSKTPIGFLGLIALGAMLICLTTSAEEAFAATAPTILTVSTSGVLSNSATIAVSVNPNGALGTAYLEYGPTEAYGARSASADIGEGETFQRVALYAGGLSPDTRYHYRVVIANSQGTVAGSDHQFVTQPSAAVFTLPDGRNYVAVTPSDKNGSGAYGVPNAVHSSPDGTRLTSIALVGFPGVQGLQEFPIYLSSFSNERWTTQGLLPPGTAPASQFGIRGYSRDLRYMLLESTAALTASATPKQRSFYLYDDVSQTYIFIAPDFGEFQIFMLGSSVDDSKIFFETREKLLPEAAEGSNIYEFAKGGLTLVDTESPAGAAAGPELGARSGVIGEHAISSDGNRVVFTDNSSGQIYMRIDGTRTVRVSRSPIESSEATVPAILHELTTDGRYVFFTSEARLTPSASATAGHPDLYRFDSETEETIDITPGTSAGAGVLGTMGASADGAYIYFAAEASLASGATTGVPNMYVWHEGDTRFIASLTGPEDPQNWLLNNTVTPQPSGGMQAARVTASGKFALFISNTSLQGYDNGSLPEIFRYSFDGNSTLCVSCNPTGAKASSEPFLASLFGADSFPEPTNFVLPRNLSEDGSVFFTSGEGLVPEDNNGQPDVYEWDASDETLHLISTGTSTEPSYFADASSDGSHVFFFTGQGLVPTDVDGNYDAYDARVGPALATQYPPTTGPACGDQVCSGEQGTEPFTASSASASLTGMGNLAPPASRQSAAPSKLKARQTHKCSKGKKLSHGKCVVRKARKRSKAKKVGNDRRGQS